MITAKEGSERSLHVRYTRAFGIHRDELAEASTQAKQHDIPSFCRRTHKWHGGACGGSTIHRTLLYAMPKEEVGPRSLESRVLGTRRMKSKPKSKSRPRAGGRRPTLRSGSHVGLVCCSGAGGGARDGHARLRQRRTTISYILRD